MLCLGAPPGLAVVLWAQPELSSLAHSVRRWPWRMGLRIRSAVKALRNSNKHKLCVTLTQPKLNYALEQTQNVCVYMHKFDIYEHLACH